jgi:hypothetical protein
MRTLRAFRRHEGDAKPAFAEPDVQPAPSWSVGTLKASPAPIAVSSAPITINIVSAKKM